MHMHTCVHINTYMQATYMYAHTGMHTHLCTHTYAHTNTHTHTHTHTHKHTNTQTHKHTNTQTHTHTNTQTHKHKHAYPPTHPLTHSLTQTHTQAHTLCAKVSLYHVLQINERVIHSYNLNFFLFKCSSAHEATNSAKSKKKTSSAHVLMRLS